MKTKKQPHRPQRPALPPAPPTDRRAVLRQALERFAFLERHAPMDFPMPEDLREIAEDLDVPYLLLLVVYYTRVTPVDVSLADIDAFTADPLVREVLDEWLAATDTESEVA